MKDYKGDTRRSIPAPAGQDDFKSPEQFGARFGVDESNHEDANLLDGVGLLHRFARSQVLAVKNRLAYTVQQTGDEEMLSLAKMKALDQSSRGEASHDAMLPEPIHVHRWNALAISNGGGFIPPCCAGHFTPGTASAR